MTTRISISKFIDSSKRYAQSAATKADANGNGNLTIAESAALPKDLQDNFGFLRADAKNHRLTASQFVDGFVAEATAAAKAADLNGDGYLNKTEAAKLKS